MRRVEVGQKWGMKWPALEGAVIVLERAALFSFVVARGDSRWAYDSDDIPQMRLRADGYPFSDMWFVMPPTKVVTLRAQPGPDTRTHNRAVIAYAIANPPRWAQKQAIDAKRWWTHTTTVDPRWLAYLATERELAECRAQPVLLSAASLAEVTEADMERTRP